MKKAVMMLAGAAMVLSLSGALKAEDVWVSSAVLEVRAGKLSLSKLLATYHKGDKLNVVDHDGDWLKVQVGTEVGFVYKTAISPQQVSADANVLRGMTGGPSASALKTGDAGRGLTEDTEKLAGARGLDPRPMRWLEDFRDKTMVSAVAELEAFMAEGRVGRR